LRRSVESAERCSALVRVTSPRWTASVELSSTDRTPTRTTPLHALDYS
jgi:hypothetical protein